MYIDGYIIYIKMTETTPDENPFVKKFTWTSGMRRYLVQYGTKYSELPAAGGWESTLFIRARSV